MKWHSRRGVISVCIFVGWFCFYFPQIFPKFIRTALIHKKSQVIQVMAWRRIDDKALFEPMVIQFTYAYMFHRAYRKISNISRTKSPDLNVSRLVLQLSLPNPMKPGVKSRMKM